MASIRAPQGEASGRRRPGHQHPGRVRGSARGRPARLPKVRRQHARRRLHHAARRHQAHPRPSPASAGASQAAAPTHASALSVPLSPRTSARLRGRCAPCTTRPPLPPKSPGSCPQARPSRPHARGWAAHFGTPQTSPRPCLPHEPKSNRLSLGDRLPHGHCRAVNLTIPSMHRPTRSGRRAVVVSRPEAHLPDESRQLCSLESRRISP